jgi:hypothetical protein
MGTDDQLIDALFKAVETTNAALDAQEAAEKDARDAGLTVKLDLRETRASTVRYRYSAQAYRVGVIKSYNPR